MKRELFLSLFIVTLCAISLTGQRYGYNASYSYGDGYYGDRYGSQSNRAAYDYGRYLNRMSRSDRRCVLDLLDKLERRERKAWRDGYITDREARRIRDVERSIDRVVDKYRRYTRYVTYGNNRNRSARNKCR